MNKNDLEKIYQWLDNHKEQIIQDLMELSSIPSVSDDHAEVKPFGQDCIDVLNAMLKKGEKAEFKIHNYENYVGSILYDAGQKENIGIWAHLDVVPAGEGWMSDPYIPVIRDGYLFGRGVSDDKSGAIGGFYIQQALRDLNIPLRHNIELFLGTNEETGMADVEYYVSKYPVPKFSFVPDAGFPGVGGEFGRLRYILESNQSLSDDFISMNAGTAFNIIPNKALVILNKGTQIRYQDLPDDFDIQETKRGIEITAYGVSSHAAFPEGGKNAIRILTSAFIQLKGVRESDLRILSFINDVNQDCYGTYLGFNKTDDISGQTVSSGTVLRYDHGKLRLLNDCRFCVTDQAQRILSCIQEKCGENDFTVEVTEESTPYYLDKNSIVIQTIQKVYQDFTGEDKEIHIGKGGTYAGLIPNAMATGISFDKQRPEGLQPGHGGAHQPDEYISIEGYMEGIKLFVSMLLAADEVL